MPSFLLAGHLPEEKKGPSSDHYYRESEYAEKIYSASM